MAPLPPALQPPASRLEREHGPFSINDLARALRGMPHDAAFWVDCAAGLRPVVGITPTHVRTGAARQEASITGDYRLVLRLGGVPPPAAAEGADPQPLRSAIEDRYRTALQAIARGRSDGSRAIAGTQVQAMARKVLVEMNDDWTKRGAPMPD